MNIDKISIILPIFNVQKYISTCLDSLVNQSYGINNMEIICVNDCTPDNSIDIAIEYQKKYPNSIKIINHKKNKGTGGARNTGLNNATGKYITFVDPDDYLDVNAYKYMLDRMQRDDIDLSCFYFNFFTDTGKSISQQHPSDSLFKKEVLISHKELLSNYPEFIHSMSVWNKIYKKKLLNDIKQFPENQLFNEDARFSSECFLHAKKIFISDKTFYHYRKNIRGVTATNKMYTTKESYTFHLTHHKYLNTIKKQYPTIASEINVFHINNWYQFIHNVLINDITINFTKKEQLYYFKETKKLFRTILLTKNRKGVYPKPNMLFFIFKFLPGLFLTKHIYKLLYTISTTIKK
jgi:glycosyltransferase involved in cell wall biosynthesis